MPFGGSYTSLLRKRISIPREDPLRYIAVTEDLRQTLNVKFVNVCKAHLQTKCNFMDDPFQNFQDLCSRISMKF